MARFLILCTILLSFVVPAHANLFQSTPDYCPLKALDMAALEDRPTFLVTYYGAKGDGVTDDTIAIQKALDETPSGAVILFPEGIYLHSKSFTLTKDGTILKGEDAILRATNPKDQTLTIKSMKNAVIGLRFEGTGTQRSSQPLTTKLRLMGRWTQILNNEIDGGASAGIFVFGAKDFRIAGNKISHTLADGIHITHGAARGLVEYNEENKTGDDGIAVVSYGKENKQTHQGQYLVSDILIRHNKVANNRGGRGITVVGGENVEISDNQIDNIWAGAGVLVAQEVSYYTEGVKNVRVVGNKISNIEIERPDAKKNFGHHAAIDINSNNLREMDNIWVEDNQINKAGFAGLRVLGNSCNVAFLNNQIENVLIHKDSKKPIQIMNAPCAPKTVQCKGNTIDGAADTLGEDKCGPLLMSPLSLSSIAAVDETWKPCE